jgi:hypothetical protein
MAPNELQDLLKKFIRDRYGPSMPEADWERDPKIEYRPNPGGGGTLVMFDFDLGLPDMHLPIRDDDHLRAVLNGAAEDDWLKGHGEPRTIPQPVIVKAKKKK